jgi:hypothetical protein
MDSSDTSDRHHHPDRAAADVHPNASHAALYGNMQAQVRHAAEADDDIDGEGRQLCRCSGLHLFISNTAAHFAAHCTRSLQHCLVCKEYFPGANKRLAGTKI